MKSRVDSFLNLASVSQRSWQRMQMRHFSAYLDNNHTYSEIIKDMHLL